MATATKKTTRPSQAMRQSVTVSEGKWNEIDVTVTGDGMLVVHRWDEKCRKMMRDKHLGKPKRKPEVKRPVEAMKDTLYRFAEEEEGTIFGVPAVAIKKATVRAFKNMDGKTMQDAKGFMHVYGLSRDETEQYELVPVISQPVKKLNYKEKLLAREMGWTEDEMLTALEEEHKYGASLREDDVRVGMGTADLRYRAAFNEWKIPFTVRYNVNLVSADELITAIDDGGQLDGICEGRPGKSGGCWGMYRVQTN